MRWALLALCLVTGCVHSTRRQPPLGATLLIVNRSAQPVRVYASTVNYTVARVYPGAHCVSLAPLPNAASTRFGFEALGVGPEWGPPVSTLESWVVELSINPRLWTWDVQKFVPAGKCRTR